MRKIVGVGKLAEVMAFTEKEEKAGNCILKTLEGMTVEEGVNILEKCIVFHALFGYQREYEAALNQYFGESSPQITTK